MADQPVSNNDQEENRDRPDEQEQLPAAEPPQQIYYFTTQDDINDACIEIKDFVERQIREQPEANVPIGFHAHEVMRVDNSQRIVKIELIALCIAENARATCYLLHFIRRNIMLPSTFTEILTNEKVIFVGGRKVVSQMNNVRIDWGIQEECGRVPLQCDTRAFDVSVAHYLERNFQYRGDRLATQLYEDLSTKRSEEQAGELIREVAQNYAATYVYLYLQIYAARIALREIN